MKRWITIYFKIADRIVMFLGGTMIIYTSAFVIPWFGNPFLNAGLIILGLYVILIPWLEEERKREEERVK